MMYIVTVYGWEGTPSTRLQVCDLDMAERVEAMMLARGYILRMDRITKAPERSAEEVERAGRIVSLLAPALFPENN